MRWIWLIALAIASIAAHAQEPWRVVVIRNWDALYRVNMMREEGLRDALLENAPRTVEIYPEQMDNLRFRKDFEAETAALLEKQYRGIRIDVVVATGIEPLDFATRYRDRIWPGAALVFLGVTEGWLGHWTRPPRTTGITTVLDVAGTLEVGVALRPRARTVHFIAGTGEFDQAYLAQARDAVKPFTGRLEPRYIVGQTREQILESVARVEPDALVFYLTVLRDASGRFGGPNNTILGEIRDRSPAPLLSAVHTQWNRGPVGGSSSRSDEHGRAGGRLVRRILEGANPDLIPIRAEPAPSCEIDWTGLQRWSIPESLVPGRCTIANRPPQIWRAYFWQFVGLLTVIVLQFALLWLVVVHSRARREAERHLREHGLEMARVARLASLGQLAASIAHEINQPLGSILSNAEAARIMLDRDKLEPPALREILDDICSEDLRATEVIRTVRKMYARGELNFTPQDLNEQVAQALHHVAMEAARRGVTLATTFAPGLPRVMGDAIELQQLVVNLAMNAVEAVADAPPDARTVAVETRALDGGAEIVVSDQGPGLAQNAARVFESSFTTKAEGMGFGLSIVKTIVDVHHGTVRHEPNAPRGAIFRVWLPGTMHRNLA
jgi:signal transduction histidine kinase